MEKSLAKDIILLNGETSNTNPFDDIKYDIDCCNLVASSTATHDQQLSFE